jgi:hypothetical protein
LLPSPKKTLGTHLLEPREIRFFRGHVRWSLHRMGKFASAAAIVATRTVHRFGEQLRSYVDNQTVDFWSILVGWRSAPRVGSPSFESEEA